jgi:nucleoside-diphosphate-sugar epimerase
MAVAAGNGADGPRVIVAVTGADGFVGRHVCAELARAGHQVRALVRGESLVAPAPYAALPPEAAIERRQWRDLDDVAALRTALDRADAVIHLAARVHVMRDHASDPLAAFRAINVEGTRRVAVVAAEAGVPHLLLASSVKAVGEHNDAAWNEQTPPAPVDPYGISKLEAEQALAEIARQYHMRAIILRLPLVYGPGMRANMLRLFRLVDRGWPIPLGGVRNRRSLLFAGNAAAAITSILPMPGHGVETYFVSDGENVSTPELLHRIGEALGRPVRLVPAPVRLLELAHRLRVPAIGPAAGRLLGSLMVDASALRHRLGGSLPFTLDEGLRQTAAWYRAGAQPAGAG